MFVYVTDLAGSLQFYTDVLGMQPHDRVVGGTVLTAGNLELELLQDRREVAPITEPSTGLTLFVADVDATFAALPLDAITLLSEPETSADGTRAFYIADPDGLPIGIFEEAQPLPPPEWILDDQGENTDVQR